MTSALALGLWTAGWASASTDTGTASNRTPVLLELFTSEGCSSCPPADRLLQMLDQSQPVSGADLIVLSEHVDYWNHDGWADPYSSALFTQRQAGYAQKLGIDSVYTPQLIVDGTAELVGSNGAGARTQIGKALGRTKTAIMFSNAVRQKDRITLHVEIGALPARSGSAAVYLALADNEDRSQVSRGENAGRSLTHVAVVRILQPVGTIGAAGFSKNLTVPVNAGAPGGLRVVVFVQEKGSRRVLGVAQQKL